MRIKNEEELLNPDIRKKIIEEIKSTENKNRKDKFYKFYQCYKDNTKEYVLRQMLKQFDADTVNEMAYSITNMGFARKIVDKLARVYNYGVEREVYVNEALDEKATEAITKITKECDVNRLFKKTNRWLKRDKNTVQYIIPRKISAASDDEKFTIKPVVLPAYLYDVVELDDNRELPVCYILSDYKPQNRNSYYTTGDASVRIKQPDSDGNYPYSDGKDSLIADAPRDQENFDGNYIFWSDKYHFTCNEKGEVIDENGMPTSIEENPIGVMPFVNYAEDQDNSFWAQGGDDLIDGAININSIITNILHIAITQGYGQAVVKGGRNTPRTIKLGPNKLIILEQNSADDPAPDFDFKTAQPPLAELRQLVEFYVALLLTTNNLSTSGISTTLGSASTFPTGIAMMIDKAESMEDIEDQAQIFKDNEPKFWNVFAKWHEVLKSAGQLEDDLAKYDLPQEFDVAVKFGKPEVLMSEKERLDILKMKKELGLISQLDILKAEFPELSDEQLIAKLEEIMNEKLEAAKQAQVAMNGMPQGEGESQNAEKSTNAEEASSKKEGQVNNDDQGK